MPRLRGIDADRRASQHDADFSEALSRGLTIIGAFEANRLQMTLGDLSKLVDLPRATVRRSLHTLMHLGYVSFDGRLFTLTPNILRLATAYRSSSPLIARLQPICDRISRQIEGLCSAAVLDDQDTMMIARAAPGQVTSIGMGLGYRVPAFCSALGRVLIAGLDDAQLADFFERLDPVRQTVHTVVDKVALREAIGIVRAQDFAYVSEESVLGFQSIAIPVRDHQQRTIAALNIGHNIGKNIDQRMQSFYLGILREHLAA